MVEIFQSLDFSVAVCVVSLMALGIIGKSLLTRIDKRDEEAAKYHERKDTELKETRDKFDAYLQMSNVELTGALKENATAFKENAEAMNRISGALERFANVLQELIKR